MMMDSVDLLKNTHSKKGYGSTEAAQPLVEFKPEDRLVDTKPAVAYLEVSIKWGQ